MLPYWSVCAWQPALGTPAGVWLWPPGGVSHGRQQVMVQLIGSCCPPWRSALSSWLPLEVWSSPSLAGIWSVIGRWECMPCLKKRYKSMFPFIKNVAFLIRRWGGGWFERQRENVRAAGCARVPPGAICWLYLGATRSQAGLRLKLEPGT